MKATSCFCSFLLLLCCIWGQLQGTSASARGASLILRLPSPPPPLPTVTTGVRTTNLTALQAADLPPSVVGGTTATSGQLFYQVLVVWWIGAVGSGDFLLCGGTLVDNLWIVTAAHCVSDHDGVALLDKTKFRVYADGGVKSTFALIGCSTCSRTVTTVHRHPDWNPTTIKNDVALLQINSAYTSTSVGAITIFPGALPALNDDIWMSGYGKVSAGGSIADALRSATLNSLPGSCNIASFPPQTADGYCAGCTSGAVGACNGDSGGPSVVALQGYCPALIGATSYGLSSCSVPSVFANIPYQRLWIEGKVGRSLASPYPRQIINDCDFCPTPGTDPCPGQLYVPAQCTSAIRAARSSWPSLSQSGFRCTACTPGFPCTPKFVYDVSFSNPVGVAGTVYFVRAAYSKTGGSKTIAGKVVDIGLGGSNFQIHPSFPSGTSALSFTTTKTIQWSGPWTGDGNCGNSFSYQTVLLATDGRVFQSLVYQSTTI